jgi:Fe-S cluster assembly iron-binding protein IscA
LGMALDESHDDDEVFTDRDVKYLVNKTLFEKVKPVAIDYVQTPRGEGFKLSSNMDAAEGCGSSCSC